MTNGTAITGQLLISRVTGQVDFRTEKELTVHIGRDRHLRRQDRLIYRENVAFNGAVVGCPLGTLSSPWSAARRYTVLIMEFPFWCCRRFFPYPVIAQLGFSSRGAHDFSDRLCEQCVESLHQVGPPGATAGNPTKERRTRRNWNAPIQGRQLHAGPRRGSGSPNETRRNH